MTTKHISLLAVLLGTSGCITPGPLGKGVASIDVPSDPCPGADKAAAFATPAAAAILAGLPTEDRSSAADPLVLGVELIRSAGATDRGARPVAPMAQYSANVEDGLGIDLAMLTDQIDDVDAQGADLAEGVLRSAPLTQLAPRSEDDRSGDMDTITLSRKQWEEFSRSVYRTTARAGWTANFARALGETALGTSRSGGDRVNLSDLRKKFLIAAYMAAYFRNGAIVSVRVDQSGIKDSLMAKLREKVKDEKILKEAEGEIDKLAAALSKQVCSDGAVDKKGCVILGAIGEQTFVTRAGKSYGFPGISVAFDPTSEQKISTNKLSVDDIASDLVRVVVEAIGDEAFKVPGTPNSTICGFNKKYCGTTAQAPFLAKVNDAGDKTEAAATGTVGTLIRGGWILSLNNELLAKTMTTGIAVSLRKTAEGAVWKRLSACPANRDAQAGRYRTFTVAFAR